MRVANLVLLGVLESISAAKAGVVVTTTMAAFDAVTVSNVVYGFANLPGPLSGPLASPFTEGPATFSAASLGQAQFPNNIPSLYFYQVPLTATIAGVYTGISFSLQAGGYGNYPIGVSVNSVFIQNVLFPSYPSIASVYLGITDTIPITSVTLSAATEPSAIYVSYFTLADATSATLIPEPSTLSALGVGLFGLVTFQGWRRRR